MGEIIRKIGTVKLNNTIYSIEINKPTHASLSQTVHIQSSTHRLELSMKDFVALCAAVEYASMNLDNYKL